VNGGGHRRWRLVASVVAGCLVALAVATAVLFVWPSTDQPRPADAIVVLGGDGARLATGVALVREGIAPTLAVSVGSLYDPCFRQHEPFTLICFRAQPLTTQGEARWLAAAAKAMGWHNVLVVVSKPQATRARVRIRRCYRGNLQVVAVHVGVRRTLADAVYEWAALLKAETVQRGC